MKHNYTLLLLALAVTSATAASTTYNVDPDHTHPSFEVDHFGGLSTWRGTFKKTSGTVAIDTEAKTGTVDVVIDTATIDFAHDKLNEHVSSAEMLDVAKYPTAEYKGKFVEFVDAAPKTISGDLTLHGVTKPITLKARLIGSGTNPLDKSFNVGFEAVGTIKRSDFGIKQYVPLVGDDVALKIAGAFVLQP